MTKYACFTLVFAPFLFSYYVPGTTINMEAAFIAFNGILFLIYNSIRRKRYVWPKYFAFFLVYSMLTPIIGATIFNKTSGIYSTYVSLLPFVLCFLGTIPIISWELLKRYYKISIYICIGFFIVQELMYYSLGWRPIGLLSFLPVSYSHTTMVQFIDKMSHIDRSMSFFLEPAHYAQYLLGYLAVVLADNCVKKIFISKESIIISLAIVLSWSGNGILNAILLWVVFFFQFRMKVIVKYGAILPIAIMALYYCFNYVSQTERGKMILDRQDESASSHQSRMSSGMIRIYRGYFVFSGMSASEQLFGVGTGFCPDVIDNSDYRFMFQDDEHYLNNAQILLVGDGWVGMVLFLMFLLGMCKRRNPYAIFQVAIFIGISLMEGFWMSGRMLIYLTIAFYSFQYLRDQQNRTALSK